jgi:hypothetical protein
LGRQFFDAAKVPWMHFWRRGQEFIIGGYRIGANGFDAVIFGYYDGDRLMYAGRTPNSTVQF